MNTRSLVADSHAVGHALRSCTSAHLDIGCGAGLATLRHARAHPETLVVGMDTCLGNLARQCRRAPDNLYFLQADATVTHSALIDCFDSASIAFPFGSLLRAFITADTRALANVFSPVRPHGTVEILINQSALVAHGGGTLRPVELAAVLGRVLCNVRVSPIAGTDVRTLETSWAKRLGYGKPTEVWRVTGRRRAPPSCAALPIEWRLNLRTRRYQ